MREYLQLPIHQNYHYRIQGVVQTEPDSVQVIIPFAHPEAQLPGQLPLFPLAISCWENEQPPPFSTRSHVAKRASVIFTQHAVLPCVPSAQPLILPPFGVQE